MHSFCKIPARKANKTKVTRIPRCSTRICAASIERLPERCISKRTQHPISAANKSGLLLVTFVLLVAVAVAVASALRKCSLLWFLTVHVSSVDSGLFRHRSYKVKTQVLGPEATGTLSAALPTAEAGVVNRTPLGLKFCSL